MTAAEAVAAIREWRYRHILDSVEFSRRLVDHDDQWNYMYANKVSYEGYFCFLHAVSQVLQPETVAEIGVLFGFGAKALVTGSSRAKRYIGWDNSCYSPNARDYAMTRVLPHLGVEWAYHDCNTWLVRTLPGVKPRSVDLGYIDAEHTVQAVWHDLMLMGPCIRPGGWILLDDVVLFGLDEPCIDFARRHNVGYAYLPTHNGAMLMGPFPE